MEGAKLVHILGVCGSALLCTIVLRKMGWSKEQMNHSDGVHGSMGLQIACNGALKSLGRPVIHLLFGPRFLSTTS